MNAFEKPETSQETKESKITADELVSKLYRAYNDGTEENDFIDDVIVMEVSNAIFDNIDSFSYDEKKRLLIAFGDFNHEIGIRQESSKKSGSINREIMSFVDDAIKLLSGGKMSTKLQRKSTWI